MSDCCESDGACSTITLDKNIKKVDKKEYLKPAIALSFLLIGIGLDFFDVGFFSKVVSFIYFGIIYLVVGKNVLLKAYKLVLKGNIYNEFTLMSVATMGAFAISSYAEGVAVMLFYITGELFQESAVNRAKQSIKALLSIQIEETRVLVGGKTIIKHPKDVKVGESIQVLSGEKVALDGTLISPIATLNTAALTGESKPDTKNTGEDIYAGSINLNRSIELKVSASYEDTKLSKILSLVQDAIGKKAKTELLISRLAKVYTPIVFWLAIALVLVPFFFLGDAYEFTNWFERALIFLVISCPCALVISIPLGYFGGIGAASHNGILFKGSNYLDIITNVDTIVMDKTGTLTKGVFELQEVVTKNYDKNSMLSLVSALESHSTHPVAKAIVEYAPSSLKAFEVEEISGHGMKGIVENKEILAGNAKLLDKFNISYDKALLTNDKTIIMVAIDKKFAGYISIADSIKDDALKAIKELYKIPKIKEIIMLSGDKQAVVNSISKELGIDRAHGDLLPEDKFKEVQRLRDEGKIVAFVGDGINDAPVITLADVGFAMGGLGSDAAIETADVVIQTDQPSKIATAIKIADATKVVIWQNITLAFGVKIAVLIGGAFGLATMWEAVIADVGVAIVAIANSARIGKMKF